MQFVPIRDWRKRAPMTKTCRLGVSIGTMQQRRKKSESIYPVLPRSRWIKLCQGIKAFRPGKVSSLGSLSGSYTPFSQRARWYHAPRAVSYSMDALFVYGRLFSYDRNALHANIARLAPKFAPQTQQAVDDSLVRAKAATS